jgi:tripartite-type tricarboxylate transporter receptor subunit TctC
MRRTLAVTSILTALALTAGTPSLAQEKYPAPTVKLVTQSSPGGGGDVFLREISTRIGKYINANFVVENIVGGGGAKAMAYLAKSTPDGSVLYGTTPTFMITSLISKPAVDYTMLQPVANLFLDPIILYVRKDSPFKTLPDVIAEAKKRPNAVRVAVGESASLDPVVMEQVQEKTGTKLIIITHDGGGDTLLSVLNGTGELGIGEVAELAGQIAAGEIRPIVAFTDARLPQFPDIATGKEQGVDLVVKKFRGLVGPKDISKDAIAAWEAAIPKLLEDTEFKKWYTEAALIPTFMKHEDYGKFLNAFAEEQRAFYIKNNIIKN